jgi:beta-glucosidase
MKITQFFTITIMSVMTVSTINAQQKLNPEIEKKIDVLMSKMTLEEKVGQMNQYNGFGCYRPAPVGGTAEQKYENIKKDW